MISRFYTKGKDKTCDNDECTTTIPEGKRVDDVDDINATTTIATKTWTTEDFTRMKNAVPDLEEHQLLQILHFILMDNVVHTKTKDGIMLNLSSAPSSFLEKLHSFLDKTERDKKYRDI